MSISIYTFIKDGIYYDFPIYYMLKHHLDFADEIVVNEGYSNDGTYDLIKNIDSKIKIIRNKWDASEPKKWSRKFKETARKHCTGDWCILLDADEFIPEWEFDSIKKQLESSNKLIYSFKYLNFYGNYKVLNIEPSLYGWPSIKYTVHNNINNIEIWGDGSNVRLREEKSYMDDRIYGGNLGTVHHFGFVRKPSKLREKWKIQYIRNNKNKWLRIPGFIFNLFPHKWDDPQFIKSLRYYHGPYINTILENSQDFVKDKYKLLKHLDS